MVFLEILSTHPALKYYVDMYGIGVVDLIVLLYFTLHSM